MPKYKLEEAVLQGLKDECEMKGKLHLLRLKSLASAFNEWYPNTIDLTGVDKMNPKTVRTHLIKVLCPHITKIATHLLDSVEAPPKPKKTSPKQNHPPKEKLPIVKPLPFENIPVIKVEIKASKANSEYLVLLKKQIADIEKKGYNIDSFEKDIQSDEFVKKAIDAHIQALEFKLSMYKKLAQINWQGNATGGGNGQGYTINMDNIIMKMHENIALKLKAMKANPNALEDKREELMNILYDPDNGIATVRGSSRESVRISMLKIIYMFLKVPKFFFNGFTNFMLTGPAGSGKTKVAGVIAHIMKNLGILATKKVTMATKQNLVGEFVGHSGPKTRSLLAGSLEGILFIDEAYTLTPCPGSPPSNFSEEAVGELINFVDKFIGCLVVIVAGYKKQMYECFLTFNEGMSRRFPKVVDLISYNSNDMYDIFETFLRDSVDVQKMFSKDKRIFIKSIISYLNDEIIFNNQAGDMLNLSKVIGEDAVLYGKDYDNEMIKLSFKKFCANKNIALHF